MATKAQKAEPGACWVLCAGLVAGKHYAAGTVLEGVPAEVVESHSAILDANPDAVSSARDAGWPVVEFEFEG